MKQSRQAGAAVVITVAMATSAHAQNSVTLYGIVDNSLTYQSSQTTLGSTKGGSSNIKMSSGVWAGSRFGLKGAEDLGALQAEAAARPYARRHLDIGASA